MARKKLIVLDPDNSFEVASRHLYRCRKCKNAGMEWARRKDLCRRGRQLLENLERIEAIYDTAAEKAAQGLPELKASRRRRLSLAASSISCFVQPGILFAKDFWI